MAEKKQLSEKESQKKIKDLKIELLKNNNKRKSIKKEIARLLTMARKSVLSMEEAKASSSSSKNQNKLMENKK